MRGGLLFRVFWNIIFILGFIGCIGGGSGGIVVTSSIEPFGYLLDRIGGGKVKVNVLIKSGVDLHHYEPDFEDLLDLKRSRMYVRLGKVLDFERRIDGMIDEILEGGGNLEVIDMSGVFGLELGDDPHIWLSLERMRVMGKEVYEGLKRIDGVNGDFYRERYEGLDREIVELDEEMRMRFGGLRRRVLMVDHGLWGYFARDYGFEELVIEGLGEGVSARGLKVAIDEGRRLGVDFILVRRGMGEKYKEGIGKELGVSVFEVDLVSREWLRSMREVMDIILSMGALSKGLVFEVGIGYRDWLGSTREVMD